MDLVQQTHMANLMTYVLLRSSLFRGDTFWRTLVANEITTVIAGAMSVAGYSFIHVTSKDSMSPYL